MWGRGWGRSRAHQADFMVEEKLVPERSTLSPLRPGPHRSPAAGRGASCPYLHSPLFLLPLLVSVPVCPHTRLRCPLLSVPPLSAQRLFDDGPPAHPYYLSSKRHSSRGRAETTDQWAPSLSPHVQQQRPCGAPQNLRVSRSHSKPAASHGSSTPSQEQDFS